MPRSYKGNSPSRGADWNLSWKSLKWCQKWPQDESILSRRICQKKTGEIWLKTFFQRTPKNVQKRMESKKQPLRAERLSPQTAQWWLKHICIAAYILWQCLPIFFDITAHNHRYVQVLLYLHMCRHIQIQTCNMRKQTPKKKHTIIYYSILTPNMYVKCMNMSVCVCRCTSPKIFAPFTS